MVCAELHNYSHHPSSPLNTAEQRYPQYYHNYLPEQVRSTWLNRAGREDKRPPGDPRLVGMEFKRGFCLHFLPLASRGRPKYFEKSWHSESKLKSNLEDGFICFEVNLWPISASKANRLEHQQSPIFFYNLKFCWWKLPHQRDQLSPWRLVGLMEHIFMFVYDQGC